MRRGAAEAHRAGSTAVRGRALDNISGAMWEERWHPLREEWVIVAAHRQSRPWSGAEVAARTPRPPAFDPTCYSLSREHAGQRRDESRLHAARSSSTTITRASAPDAPRELAPPAGIYRNRPATGVARVVCYSPRHDVTLAELDVDGVDALLADVAAADAGTGDASRCDVRPDLREQGRSRRRQQPAPALPDLRDQLHVQDIETELRPAAGTSTKPAGTLFQDILAAEQQDGRRIIARARQRDRVRAVLRALRVRNVRRAAAERRDHRGSRR